MFKSSASVCGLMTGRTRSCARPDTYRRFWRGSHERAVRRYGRPDVLERSGAGFPAPTERKFGDVSHSFGVVVAVLDAPASRTLLAGSGEVVMVRSAPQSLRASRRGTTTVTAQHTQPEPHERSNQRSHEDEQPERPGEVPEQEVDRDVLGVLDHEDEQRPSSGQGGDGAPAESTPSVRRVGGGSSRTLTFVCHDDSLDMVSHGSVSTSVEPAPWSNILGRRRDDRVARPRTGSGHQSV